MQSIDYPLLATIVEEGCYDNEIAQLAVKEYLQHFSKKLEIFILGCTHYPLLTNIIQKQIWNEVEIINIGTHVSQEIYAISKQRDMASKTKHPELKIYLTDIECKFNKLASNLLEKEVEAEIIKE